jgi:hypothetical protein
MKNEDLVQRFVDQELSADERMQFVVALGRNSALRARVLELEQLVIDTARLPRPVVPDGFVARVMDASRDERAMAAADGGRWRHLLAALWAPRTLQWNFATAAAAACVVVLAVAGALSMRGTDAPANVASAAPPAESRPTVLVRLVVVRPGASVVQAAGDFNGWNPAETPLEQTADGAWTVTLPLEPGRYEYQFVVDGEQWIGDPFAAEQSDDGFGSRNAVLDVRPLGQAAL